MTTPNTPANGGQILTEALLLKAARALAVRHAEVCNVNADDNWNLYGNDFINDVRIAFAAIEADLRASLAAPATENAPNGIAATHWHDAGAIARCSYCGRYSLDHATLGADRYQPVCECGKQHGWCGSFVRPDANSTWSGKSPAAPAIPTVDRNSILEEVEQLCTTPAARYLEAANEKGIDPETRNVRLLLSEELLDMQKAIRAIKSAAPANVPQTTAPEWKGGPYCWFHEPSATAHRISFAPSSDCFALYTEQQVRERIAAAQPAAQVAVSEPDLLWDASDPEDGTHGDSPANFAENYASNCMSAGDVVTVDVLCATRSNTRQMHIAIDPDPEAENWLSWKWATPATVKTAEGL